jgi:hypothetical protein
MVLDMEMGMGEAKGKERGGQKMFVILTVNRMEKQQRSRKPPNLDLRSGAVPTLWST